jgi:beta-phosphoglucomutase
MNSKTLQACLFDLDGVIVDTAVYHFEAWRRLANELGFDFSEHQNEQLKGVSRMESLDKILAWGKVTLTEAEKLEWATKKNEWYLEFVRQMPKEDILPGVREFLQQLKAQKIKIGLGSASKNAILCLERIEVLDMFDTIVDGRHISKGKPDPQVFLMGAQALGVDATNCVVFEDALAGVEAGKNAGMFVVGVGAADVLTKADMVINTFEGLHTDKIKELM